MFVIEIQEKKKIKKRFKVLRFHAINFHQIRHDIVLQVLYTMLTSVIMANFYHVTHRVTQDSELTNLRSFS